MTNPEYEISVTGPVSDGAELGRQILADLEAQTVWSTSPYQRLWDEFRKPCDCGHELGVHLAMPPYPCTECDCGLFDSPGGGS